MDRKIFFDRVRPMFGGRIKAIQVSRVEAVLDGLEKRKVPASQAAYVLATAHHESDEWKALTVNSLPTVTPFSRPIATPLG
jgi:hypothetical protein